MKFRKKPVEIEAVRNDGEWAPILAWLDSLTPSGRYAIPVGSRPPITRDMNGTMVIETLEGTMRADIGDWIICGVKGEFYPCKPDIFAATYDDASAPQDATPRTIRIVFEPVVDEHTGHDEFRFVEIENDRGESIVVGNWHEGDGLRWLTIDLPSVNVDPLGGAPGVTRHNHGFVP